MGPDEDGLCKWDGDIEFSMWALWPVGIYVSAEVEAFGTDKNGWQYAIRAEGGNWIHGATMGVGYFTVNVDLDGYEAKCKWPINDGDQASVGFVGAGISVGLVPINLAWVCANAGSFRMVQDGPFEVGGLNIYVAGGGMGADVYVTHRVGPTLP